MATMPNGRSASLFATNNWQDIVAEKGCKPVIAISQMHDNEIKIFDQARVWLKLMEKGDFFEIPCLSYYMKVFQWKLIMFFFA